MKAAVYDVPGTPGVLRYADVPTPEVANDQVLISVEAISVDGRDLAARRSTPPPREDWVVGCAAAGTVVAVGSCIENRKVGDRVAAFDAHGSHAEFWAVPALRTWLVPEEVGTAEAAVFPAAFGTAHNCLFTRGQLRRGETVLIQNAGSDVGLAAVQLASRMGANVLAAVNRGDHHDLLRSLGAYHVIDQDSRNVARDALRITGGRGVDLVVDTSSATLWTSHAALAAEGRLVFFGTEHGDSLNTGLASLQENQTALRVQMGSLLETHLIHVAVERMLGMLASREIQIVIDRRFSLHEAAAAHAYAEASDPFGCVVITP